MNYLDFKIRGHINGIHYPCLVDIKYDGMPVILKAEKGKPVKITTETGKEYTMGHLGQLKTSETLEVMGEWIHGSGKNGTLYDLTSAKADDLRLGETNIKIFDIIEFNGESFVEKSLLSRRGMLVKMFNAKHKLVESLIVDNAEQLEQFYQNAIAAGYEGIVVKNLNETLLGQTWVKMKAEDEEELPVTSYSDTKFTVNRNGVEIGVAYNTSVPFQEPFGGLQVLIKHNGVQASGSLRNPVAVRRV